MEEKIDSSIKDPPASQIKEVWAENLEDEFKVINELIEKYNYVGMDTEYPGIYSAFQNEANTKEAGYKFIKSNVDQQKLIQVGLTLSNEDGETPSPICTWQFNFKFNLQLDLYVADSINLLKDAGIDFKNQTEFGIDPIQFAELLLSSGMVLNEEIKWVTFHGSFDFAYLLKNLIYSELPATKDSFMEYIKIFFPNVYDQKIIVAEMNDFKSGSLQKLACDLDIRRQGTQHQAGSDALLTLLSFCKLKDLYFPDGFTSKITNKIYGQSNDTGLYHQSTYTANDYQNAMYQNQLYGYYTSSYSVPSYYSNFNDMSFNNGYYQNDLSQYYAAMGQPQANQSSASKYLNSQQPGSMTQHALSNMMNSQQPINGVRPKLSANPPPSKSRGIM